MTTIKLSFVDSEKKQYEVEIQSLNNRIDIDKAVELLLRKLKKKVKEL